MTESSGTMCEPRTYWDFSGDELLCSACDKESCGHLQAWGTSQLSQKGFSGNAQGCLGTRLTFNYLNCQEQKCKPGLYLQSLTVGWEFVLLSKFFWLN